MSSAQVASLLEQHGIRPTRQRLAIAQLVLGSHDHLSADRVHARVPKASRATVYNTLNLLVGKGLIREVVLAAGNVVYDANLDRHHHFIDETTGRISDLPWDAVQVGAPPQLPGVEVTSYEVVVRGRRISRRRQP
jgi:Fur family iron response transcriptional regulator